jgi:hypothetical protein
MWVPERKKERKVPEICQNSMWKISKAISIQQARDVVAYQA